MEDPGGRQDQGPVSIMLDQAKDRHSMPVRESGMSGGCRVVWTTFEQFCHDWYSGRVSAKTLVHLFIALVPLPSDGDWAVLFIIWGGVSSRRGF